MDFPELLVILAVAFVFLGPERMMEVATKLGEFLRKARETWDELRYQLYMESINRKIAEESKNTNIQEDYGEEYVQEVEMQEVEKGHGEPGTSQNAADGASEGAKKQTD
ncbi:MAG: twin-arginine translocase TatA/TatE family subunit [Aquificaceae bacterium]|nr:twin-arginine translocase TatA/TatE family subunit [Aquificaceae bacterium]